MGTTNWALTMPMKSYGGNFETFGKWCFFFKIQSCYWPLKKMYNLATFHDAHRCCLYATTWPCFHSYWLSWNEEIRLILALFKICYIYILCVRARKLLEVMKWLVYFQHRITSTEHRISWKKGGARTFIK